MQARKSGADLSRMRAVLGATVVALLLCVYGFIELSAPGAGRGDDTAESSQAINPNRAPDDVPEQEGVQSTGSEVLSLPDAPGGTQSAEPGAHAIRQGLLQATMNERLEAIAALGERRDGAGIPMLRSLLDDPDPAVREEAVETLGVAGGTGAVEGLAYALSDPDVMVRQSAIQTLAGLGGTDAIDTLALTLNDPDPELRMLAIEVLADDGGDAAIGLLRLFASDDHRRVREMASEYLAEE